MTNEQIIASYYRFLSVSPDSTDRAITVAYKKLALKYHPDKNPERVDWANKVMSELNTAYSAIMTHRFTSESGKTDLPKKESAQTVKKESVKKQMLHPDEALRLFVKYRESVNESLYRYFQYSLYNLPRRESISNQAIFSRIVFNLRKCYHNVKRLIELTTDQEISDHCHVFIKMIFLFYKASECLNINDSYRNILDVKAFREYRSADEFLHHAQKELFYDRHNRGVLKRQNVATNLTKALTGFNSVLTGHPQSSWTVEADIKFEYTKTLTAYYDLFFPI